jgi:hypothetical protein
MGCLLCHHLQKELSKQRFQFARATVAPSTSVELLRWTAGKPHSYSQFLVGCSYFRTNMWFS